MEKKQGFIKMSVPEFEAWLASLRVGRTVLKIQQHHTFNPSYVHFSGANHFERQSAMKSYHINQNGWRDIGQHFTVFPDGEILTGRSLESSPACIYNQNAHCICIESLGNFDLAGDTMSALQKEAIISVTASLCRKFNLAVNSNTIVYHHWFRLDNGFRNNGAAGNKSCPGTNFFGGNKVADFERHFAPLVTARLQSDTIKSNTDAVLKYVSVAASILNIRSAPTASSAKAKERSSIEMGSILRVYEEKDNWLKISNSLEHWVAGRYTDEVRRATVNAASLNVRTGPGVHYPKASNISKGEVVFIYEQTNGWCRIDLEDRWVSKAYLKL